MQTSSQLPENVPMHISTLHILDSEYFQILIFSAPDPKVQKRIKVYKTSCACSMHVKKNTRELVTSMTVSFRVLFHTRPPGSTPHRRPWTGRWPREHTRRGRDPPPKTPCCPKVSPRKMKAISVAQSGCEAEMTCARAGPTVC